MSERIIEIEVSCCGDCPYYNFNKHCCKKGAIDPGKATDSFYADCPLNWRDNNANET